MCARVGWQPDEGNPAVAAASPLAYAIRKDHVDIVRTLLMAGASLHGESHVARPQFQ